MIEFLATSLPDWIQLKDNPDGKILSLNRKLRLISQINIVKEAVHN
jgi:hypothetical protein